MVQTLTSNSHDSSKRASVGGIYPPDVRAPAIARFCGGLLRQTCKADGAPPALRMQLQDISLFRTHRTPACHHLQFTRVMLHFPVTDALGQYAKLATGLWPRQVLRLLATHHLGLELYREYPALQLLFLDDLQCAKLLVRFHDFSFGKSSMRSLQEHGTPEAFAEHLQCDIAMWSKVVKESGARAE